MMARFVSLSEDVVHGTKLPCTYITHGEKEEVAERKCVSGPRLLGLEGERRLAFTMSESPAVCDGRGRRA